MPNHKVYLEHIDKSVRDSKKTRIDSCTGDPNLGCLRNDKKCPEAKKPQCTEIGIAEIYINTRSRFFNSSALATPSDRYQ